MLRLLVTALIFISISAYGANSCEGIFNSQSQYSFSKNDIVYGAFVRAKINRPTSDKIQDVIEDWKITQASPYKLEALATRLVFAKEGRRSFWMWFKEEILWGKSTVKVFETRYEILALKEALRLELQQRGLAKPNTIFDSIGDFKAAHHNKYQMVKLVVFNYLSMKYLGLPMYFPSFNLIGNLELTIVDLQVIRTLGIKKALDHFKAKNKWTIGTHQVIEKTPQILFLATVSQIFWMYYSYESPEIVKPQVELITEKTEFYQDWEKIFEERFGRSPNLTIKEDKESWVQTRNTIYRVWASQFQEQQGRAPDLTNPQDLKAFEEFWSSLES